VPTSKGGEERGGGRAKGGKERGGGGLPPFVIPGYVPVLTVFQQLPS